ncbi:MAG TPA: Gfo/Idh/MocA family oxidoreductase [Anaerolineales bacterium]|nr:Gfo/Idh/MocA family oxidoreductase [Anaerolineales bacterium]
MARLRVGVIGCGTIAQIMHLPYLRQLNDLYEISALCDVSRQVLEAMGEHYGVERRYTDYHELLMLDLDAVLLLIPGSHAPAALAALRSGKHVLVEKPMCFTLAEADQLIEAAESSGRTLMVGYMKRYDPGYRHAQTSLPRLGELRYIQINTLHPAEEPFLNVHRLVRAGDLPAETLRQLASEKDRLVSEAIGPVSQPMKQIYTEVLLGSLVHDINALRGLVGEPQAVEYTAIWPADEVLPVITTVLRVRDQLRAAFVWAYLPDYHDYFEEIALMSAGGRIRIQFPSPYLRHFPTPIVIEGMQDGAAVKQHITASYAEAFKEQLLHFHRCVTTGERPLTDARDARKDIEILQQVLAAANPPGLGGEAIRLRAQDTQRRTEQEAR